MLFVRNNIQIGIQAKLRPTIKLLYQTVISKEMSCPHYIAVVIGNSSFQEQQNFGFVASSLKFIYVNMSVHISHWLDNNNLKTNGKLLWKYYRHYPIKSIWTPPFIPDLKAGVSSPKTISPWKIVAVKAQLIAQQKGWISIIDVKEILKNDIPDCKESYYRTIIQTFFTCTNDSDPRNKKCKKWILKNRRRPSDLYKEVFEALKDGKNV